MEDQLERQFKAPVIKIRVQLKAWQNAKNYFNILEDHSIISACNRPPCDQLLHTYDVRFFFLTILFVIVDLLSRILKA